MKGKSIVIVFLFLMVANTFGQSNFDMGFLPKIAVSKKLSDTYKWTNSVETRNIIYDDEYKLKFSLFEFTSLVSYKIDGNHSFNFGYLLRLRNSEAIHRSIQHYNYKHSFNSLKIGHRVGFEQFFQKNKNPTYRARYRASIEKPLFGDSVGVKDWYLKFGNEYLYDFDDEDVEIRFAPYLGFRASKRDKIEVGLDYRISNIIHNTTDNDLWFRLSWNISL